MILMKRHGVSYLKNIEIEVKMDSTPSEVPPSQVVIKKSEPIQQAFNMGPETAAAAPPVEMEIPHHENQVAKLLKLSDEALVDALFPEGAPPRA